MFWRAPKQVVIWLDMMAYDMVRSSSLFLIFRLPGHITFFRFLCQTSTRHKPLENLKCICTNSECRIRTRGSKTNLTWNLLTLCRVGCHSHNNFIFLEIDYHPLSAFDNYFLQAQRVRQLIKNDFDHAFSIPNYFSDSPALKKPTGVDVLIHPSAIQTAPMLGSNNPEDSTLDAYVQDVLTVPASLAGLPALSVPVRRSIRGTTHDDHWPIGISVVGQWGTEEMVLLVGAAIESLQSNFD